MKVIKPQKIGLVTRCFEHERRFYWSLGVLALHRFGGALTSETGMWPFLAGELGQDGVPDAGMPKSCAEFLVSGFAFSPRGAAQPARTVHVEVGTLEKTLWVYGNRFWTADDLGAEIITDPEPLVQMPISWKTAFGGPGFERNPLGKGYAPVDTEHGPVHPLPNVELPGQAITARSNRPEPAGLGPIDLTWPQRFSKSGTYDAEWMEQLSPGFAKDIDWSIFNLAPEDQQQDAPFRGDEAFHVYGMHPEKSQVEGRLPGLTARCFVNMRADDGEALREVAMRLTTVWLFPHAERYLLVYHGLQEVAEEDAADVLQAMIAAEGLGEPRPVEHYQQVLAQRLDPDRGALYALRDKDLLPDLAPAEDEPDGAMAAMDGLMETEGLRQKYQRQRLEREIEEARALVASQGLDPDIHGPPLLPPEEPEPSLDELPEMFEKLERDAERMRKEAEEQQQKRKEELRTRLTADGLDADAILAEAEQPPAGPPRFSAHAEIDTRRAQLADRRALGLPPDPLDRMAEDPEEHRRLFETEDRMREGYRQMAHHQGAAPRLAGAEADAARVAALKSLAEGGSLARHDLTGFDLSGLDLRGVDLNGAWLENANLAGTNLAGANLSEAVLARADLTEADLSGAHLRKANLGLAQLVRTRADGADLSEAILGKARLDGATFRKATLESADLKEAEIQAADMTGAVLREAMFLNDDLRGLRLAGADLGKAILLEVDVRGVDFSGASLEGATFLKARGEGAVFAGARMANARFVQQGDFAGADFREAILERANLRGTRLSGSDFSGARLGGADLSECDLTGASLSRANARDALFTKANLSGAQLVSANLMSALLQRANLAGADLRGANLFQADLARVLTDAATELQEANLKKARVHPRAASA
jgi:uncharacterized protein YjbI with pentapeptide repeats